LSHRFTSHYSVCSHDPCILLRLRSECALTIQVCSLDPCMLSRPVYALTTRVYPALCDVAACHTASLHSEGFTCASRGCHGCILHVYLRLSAARHRPPDDDYAAVVQICPLGPVSASGRGIVGVSNGTWRICSSCSVSIRLEFVSVT
jgi:hypothetical protein